MYPYNPLNMPMQAVKFIGASLADSALQAAVIDLPIYGVAQAGKCAPAILSYFVRKICGGPYVAGTMGAVKYFLNNNDPIIGAKNHISYTIPNLTSDLLGKDNLITQVINKDSSVNTLTIAIEAYDTIAHGWKLGNSTADTFAEGFQTGLTVAFAYNGYYLTLKPYLDMVLEGTLSEVSLSSLIYSSSDLGLTSTIITIIGELLDSQGYNKFFQDNMSI